MDPNSKRSADTPRKIAPAICRAFMCAAGLGLASANALAQTTVPPMAYTADSYNLVFDCGGPGACDSPHYRVAIASSIVRPWERFDGSEVFGSSPTWSPDGSLIAFTNQLNIFVIPALGAVTQIQITNDPSRQFQASAWSPDGQQIAFVAWNTETHGYEVGVVNPDGSGARTLSTVPVVTDGHPAWSPDSARIAFTCVAEINNVDICIVNRDGTGLVRLTSDAAEESSPVWSPDGTRIAFSTDRFGNGNVLALMNADGSGASPIGTSIAGWPGSWSPDGAQIAFTAYGPPGELCYVDDNSEFRCLNYFPTGISMTTLDGAVVTPLVGSGSPAWRPAVPLATFTFVCNSSTCDFDASGSSDSDGTITGYGWDFGDRTTATGVIQTHAYAAHGSFPVTLTTTDNRGATGRRIQTVTINSPPVASFTPACSALTCAFDARGSSDIDGTIVSYAWNFGDGTTGSGPAPSHTYAAGGSYPVSLLITDNVGATASQTATVTVVPTSIHIGDLDRASTTQGNTWTATATISVHDSSHLAVANAVVSGSWSDGSLASCTTNPLGQCSVVMPRIPRKTANLRFSVTTAALAGFVYKPANNHDPDGESDGTTITISR
jgi:PKD repeat protein